MAELRQATWPSLFPVPWSRNSPAASWRQKAPLPKDALTPLQQNQNASFCRTMLGVLFRAKMLPRSPHFQDRLCRHFPCNAIIFQQTPAERLLCPINRTQMVNPAELTTEDKRLPGQRSLQSCWLHLQQTAQQWP